MTSAIDQSHCRFHPATNVHSAPMEVLLPGDMTFALFAMSVFVALFAGIIKGMVGFAMPLIMVSGLSTILDPKLALALLILPIMASNTLQVFQAGWRLAGAAIRDFWRFLVVVVVAIFAAAQLVTVIPDQTFYLVVGVPVVTLCLIQLAGWRPQIRPENRNIAEWITGLIAGVVGGVAGTWGAPTVLFLLAINTPKAQAMVVQGVIYGAGGFVLFAAHVRSGILNGDTMPLSAFLIVPAFVGMWIGGQMQNKMDAEMFRRVTLVVLVVLGINMLRQGLGF